MSKYRISEHERFKYVGLVLLNEIINFQNYFPVKLVHNGAFLEPYLQQLHSVGCLRIEKGKYVPTEAGRNEVVNFYKKYYEYLKLFDIFCAVDLENGTFAFSEIDDFESDDEWFSYLEDEKFSDVRVAVAEFKGLDPREIVFMSFLNEGRFELQGPNWEMDLTGASVWDEIQEICSSAVSYDYLMEDGSLENVVVEGTKVALDIIKNAEAVVEEFYEEENEDEYETYVEIVEVEEIYEDEYWDPYYYDPFYVSPIWLVPILLF